MPSPVPSPTPPLRLWITTKERLRLSLWKLMDQRAFMPFEILTRPWRLDLSTGTEPCTNFSKLDHDQGGVLGGAF